MANSLVTRFGAWVAKQTGAVPIESDRRGFIGFIREAFAGAWQQNFTLDAPTNIFQQSTVYACIGGISGDIGKLRPMLMEIQSSGVWKEVTRSEDPLVAAALKVLRKPNPYQNRIKFIAQYIISKLAWGNAYVFKIRNARTGMIDEMHVLDPCRVQVLVVPTTREVFYALRTDNLTGTLKDTELPASEIVHDPMVPLFHPLMGVSPIYACGMTATLAGKILKNSGNFFANASRPSGLLTAPGEISDTTATRIKEYWELNFSGSRIGRLAVLGDGLKYESMTIPAVDAQLIEQLKWSVEDIARCFHYPLYKLGGQQPTYNNIESLLQTYYSDCLQELIECFELSMLEGFGLDPMRFKIELDLRALLRMDSSTRYERHNKAIAGGWMQPNEARLEENHEPVEGGSFCYMQSQNQPLHLLANPPAPAAPGAPALPAPDDLDDEEDESEASALLEVIKQGLETEPA